MTHTHEFFMHRCLDLARNGLGSVAPNPVVGAVVVHNGKIIGEGFHTEFGKPHAEVEAVNQVKDQSLLPDSTLYVNLEPCNHQGKTPPCTDLILEKGIGRVVIGQSDPNRTAGGGIERLRNAGVGVIDGIRETESRWLNRRFNTFHELKRPYLILKWAQTTDGFVDTLRDKPDNQMPPWITDETCRRLVHKWRSEEQAILAGSQTLLLDNPQLNIRVWTGNNPLRITIDRRGQLFFRDQPSPQHQQPITGNRQLITDNLHPTTDNRQLTTNNFFDHSVPTLVYSGMDYPGEPNLEFFRILPDEPVWPQVLTDLYNRNIQSVLVEGGPTLFETLIRENLWDEARVFIGPGWFGSGVRAPHFPFEPKQQGEAGNSQLMRFYREDVMTCRDA